LEPGEGFRVLEIVTADLSHLPLRPRWLPRGWGRSFALSGQELLRRLAHFRGTNYIRRSFVAVERLGSDGMPSGSNSAEQCRAMALLCRQQAAIDPDKRWDLLARAESWEHLAAQQIGNADYPGRRLVEDASSRSGLTPKPRPS